MEVGFPGGVLVDVRYGRHTIRTDQPASDGGSDSAPSPFALFFASIASCAGYYVLQFCKSRNIPSDGITLALETARGPGGKMVEKVGIVISVPESFPPQYRDALARAAESCTVKKHIQQPPAFEITVAEK